MLDHIKFTKFKFILQATDNIRMPEYKGAVFRGGFGYTFKRIVCAQRIHNDCTGCMLQKNCAYSYIFETPLPDNSKILRLYKTVLHPFVLEPPQGDNRIIKTNEEFEINILLIGKAIDYLPYIILTFIELGKKGIGSLADQHPDKGKFPDRGKFILKDVQNIDMNHNTQSIYNYDKQTVENNYPVLEAANLNHIDADDTGNNRQLEVRFITPCRIKSGGKINDAMEFHILVRGLLRRISSLSAFHCSKELECDYNALIDEAKKVKTKSINLKWHDWERFSTRQKQKMTLGGVKGNIIFEGNINPFLQLLRLGEYLHVGKNTSFGLGKYEIN